MDIKISSRFWMPSVTASTPARRPLNDQRHGQLFRTRKEGPRTLSIAVRAQNRETTANFQKAKSGDSIERSLFIQ